MSAVPTPFRRACLVAVLQHAQPDEIIISCEAESCGAGGHSMEAGSSSTAVLYRGKTMVSSAASSQNSDAAPVVQALDAACAGAMAGAAPRVAVWLTCRWGSGGGVPPCLPSTADDERM